MSISFNAIEIKHERRIRLLFSRPLDSGAFGIAPALYVITSVDDSGISPGVQAAMVVTGSPAVVELALDNDIVEGAQYTVSAVGVPGDDASTTPGGSILPFRYGRTATYRDVEPLRRNREDLLYGIDLLWTGSDYQETASGDLDRAGGTPNVVKALYRGMESRGLTWDQSYGAKVRDFVDSPSPLAGTLKGSVTAQVLRDPRVKKVKVTVSTENEKTYLNVFPTLISGADLKPVSLEVPQDG